MQTTDLLTYLKDDKASRMAMLGEGSPLYTMLFTNKISKQPTKSPEFKWYEDNYLSMKDTVKTTQTNGAETTLAVDTPGLFKVGTLFKVTKTTGNAGMLNMVCLVTAKSGSDLTIVRQIGSTGDATNELQDGDELLIIGEAYAEGSDFGEVQSTTAVEAYGYTQIFKTPIAISGTADASETYIGNERKYQTDKKMVEHTQLIERACLFGVRHKQGNNQRMTDGLFNRAGVLASSISNEAGFNTSLASVFKYGSRTKYLLAGDYVMDKINSYALARVHTAEKVKVNGVNIVEVQSPFGTLNLVYEPLLSEGDSYSKKGVVFDPNAIKMRTLRPTVLQKDLPTTSDKHLDQWITELGLQVENPEKHSIMSFN